ncbi:enolase-phosphatase E1 isoform X1 [Rana temporaria]|uniref:enolase-phosphatase E1 isoform X1 n=1 Tax=Rana temporaria TaxID=8407 RepID=UPI001AAD79C8|nr:enolase-phosphatase E1 isoform X1 [Rana temporaria]XP_040181109.1 enolase-phosphatase E1 isoform X1 [Rana temporaria]
MTISLQWGEDCPPFFLNRARWPKVPFVKNIIAQGYNLEFSECPPSRFYVAALPRDQEKSSAMTSLLKDLIQQEVIVQVPKQEGRGVLLPYSPGEKTFKQVPTNFESEIPEQINTVQTLLHGHNSFHNKVVNARVLHGIPGSKRRLPTCSNSSGLRTVSSPGYQSEDLRIFTKVMAEALEPLKLRGVSVVPYLDDLLYFADSRDQFVTNLQILQTHLKSLGWLLNLEKSNLDPAQEMRFLGYTINSVLQKVFLPQEKMEKVFCRESDLDESLFQYGQPWQYWASSQPRSLMSSGRDYIPDPSGEHLTSLVAPGVAGKTFQTNIKSKTCALVVEGLLQSDKGSLMGPSFRQVSVNRRKFLGMGSPPGWTNRTRVLVQSGSKEVVKLARAKSHFPGSPCLSTGGEGTSCTGSVRQHNSSSLRAQTRRNQEPRSRGTSQ